MIEVGVLIMLHYMTGSEILVVVPEIGPRLAKMQKWVPKMTLQFGRGTGYRSPSLSVR